MRGINNDPIVVFKGEYRFLSNFEPLSSPIFDDARIPYFTVENAFQAQKTMDLHMRREIQRLTPAKAKIAGRRVALRAGWDELRVAIMMQLLLQKFLNNPSMAELLLKTGQRELIEGNDWGDKFWGVCGGVGLNMLGRLLTHVRYMLRGEVL